MDYEQKYKDAIERAMKYLYDTEKCMSTEFFNATERAMQEIFPELKESEDEKIRKTVIEMIHDTPNIECEENYNVRKEDVLVWLEKQGGQKSSAWSEEDIRNIENIDSVLFYDKYLPEDTCMRLRNWLKSLKQRIGG